MNLKIKQTAILIAFGVFNSLSAHAQETTAPAAQNDVLPTMEQTFEIWTQSKFSFEALISNRRRSRPEFQFEIDGIRYPVLFDAGREKRNAILDCLDLADKCELKGSAFMAFDSGKMKLNVTDINWLSIPPIDFDAMASRIHRCFKSTSRKKKAFSSIVEAKLTIEDLERRQGFKLTPVKPREGGRGYDMVELSVENCMGSRLRLPIGDYSLKVYTQSGETFMDYWED